MSDNNKIYELSITQTQYATIRVRAASEQEALEHVSQNPSVTADQVWDKPEYDTSLVEVYEDGEFFDIDLVEEDEADVVTTGTLMIKKAPLNALVVVIDAKGARHELRANDKHPVAAGLCNWAVFVDGEAVQNGTYEIYANEFNPLIIK